MSYSSESCMVSEEKAKKMKISEIVTKERREKMKAIFEIYMARVREEVEREKREEDEP